MLKQTSLSFVWFYQSVFLSKFVAFHPRTVKRIVTALMPSLLFRCFSLFLPHLRTLAQGKRSENCLRFGTGGPSLCLYPLLSRNILFFPALTMAARAKKKNSGEAICSRYKCALSGFWARLSILNLIARLCQLCYNYYCNAWILHNWLNNQFYLSVKLSIYGKKLNWSHFFILFLWWIFFLRVIEHHWILVL